MWRYLLGHTIKSYIFLIISEKIGITCWKQRLLLLLPESQLVKQIFENLSYFTKPINGKLWNKTFHTISFEYFVRGPCFQDYFLEVFSLITIEMPLSSNQIKLNWSLSNITQSFWGELSERESCNSSGSDTENVYHGLFITYSSDKSLKGSSSIIDFKNSPVIVWYHKLYLMEVTETTYPSLGDISLISGEKNANNYFPHIWQFVYDNLSKALRYRKGF